MSSVLQIVVVLVNRVLNEGSVNWPHAVSRIGRMSPISLKKLIFKIDLFEIYI